MLALHKPLILLTPPCHYYFLLKIGTEASASKQAGEKDLKQICKDAKT